MIKKSIVCIALLLAVLLMLCSCDHCVKEPVISISAGVMDPPAPSGDDPAWPGLNAEQQSDVSRDEKYDAVFLNVSIEDFLNAGFRFGDSCDVTFSNGLSLEDIPFYNGYYVRSGDPLIVGYPGYKFIAVTCNNQGLWSRSGLKNGDNATVTLREEGKYLSVQEALSQSYSNDRGEYADDATFANFRPLRGGRIKPGLLYRGASPVDSSKNRAPYANALLAENGIGFILDLADSEEDLAGYVREEGFCSDYAKALYDKGCMALLSMSSSYGSDTYKQKLASGLRQMLGAAGKIYVHCLEGKDRTGFVCILLEALSGASYDEMLSDYMITYDNYYHVTQDSAPEKYDAIVDLYFNAFAAYLHGTEDLAALKAADYTQDAENYLLSGGMTSEEIKALRALITE